jgi:hypothetical protein
MHVALLSDRLIGLAVVISSLCKSKTSTYRIHFHIISENDIVGFGTELGLFQAREPDTQLDSLSVNETIRKLKDAGFDMSWLNPPADQENGALRPLTPM